MTELVNKLKIIKAPTRKSMRDLMNDLLVDGYSVTVEQIGYVIIRIDKRGVPMSLNGKKEDLKL